MNAPRKRWRIFLQAKIYTLAPKAGAFRRATGKVSLACGSRRNFANFYDCRWGI